MEKGRRHFDFLLFSDLIVCRMTQMLLCFKRTLTHMFKFPPLLIIFEFLYDLLWSSVLLSDHIVDVFLHFLWFLQEYCTDFDLRNLVIINGLVEFLVDPNTNQDLADLTRLMGLKWLVEVCWQQLASISNTGTTEGRLKFDSLDYKWDKKMKDFIITVKWTQERRGRLASL